MSSTPPTDPDIGGTVARVQRHSVTYFAISAPLTLTYLASVFYITRSTRGPSSLLGLPPNSGEAVLVDVLCGIIPLVPTIAISLLQLKRSEIVRRTAFQSANAQDTLVKPRMYPALSYRVQGAQMQIDWNVHGPVRDGAMYPLLDKAQLLQFQPERFIVIVVPKVCWCWTLPYPPHMMQHNQRSST